MIRSTTAIPQSLVPTSIIIRISTAVKRHHNHGNSYKGKLKCQHGPLFFMFGQPWLDQILSFIAVSQKEHGVPSATAVEGTNALEWGDPQVMVDLHHITLIRRPLPFSLCPICFICLSSHTCLHSHAHSTQLSSHKSSQTPLLYTSTQSCLYKSIRSFSTLRISWVPNSHGHRRH